MSVILSYVITLLIVALGKEENGPEYIMICDEHVLSHKMHSLQQTWPQVGAFQAFILVFPNNMVLVHGEDISPYICQQL